METHPTVLLSTDKLGVLDEVMVNPMQRLDLPGYELPNLELIYYPKQPNLFDGFTVSGRAWGSDIDNSFVYVTVAGVTRRGKIADGLWAVAFEDGSLPRHFSGNKLIVAHLRDAIGQITRTSVSVYVEEFVDSFVTVDDAHLIDGFGAAASLCASGELNLGSHLEERELVVLLVRDDAEACVVAAGLVDGGWRHGEWRAAIPLADVKSGGYKVRAQLMDGANAALTRVALSTQAILI